MHVGCSWILSRSRSFQNPLCSAVAALLDKHVLDFLPFTHQWPLRLQGASGAGSRTPSGAYLSTGVSTGSSTGFSAPICYLRRQIACLKCMHGCCSSCEMLPSKKCRAAWRGHMLLETLAATATASPRNCMRAKQYDVSASEVLCSCAASCLAVIRAVSLRILRDAYAAKVPEWRRHTLLETAGCDGDSVTAQLHATVRNDLLTSEIVC
jgi:hypothetical protein